MIKIYLSFMFKIFPIKGKAFKIYILIYFTREKENFIGGKTNVFLLQWTEFCLFSSIHRGFLLISNGQRFSSHSQWMKLWLSSLMDGGIPFSFNGWRHVSIFSFLFSFLLQWALSLSLNGWNSSFVEASLFQWTEFLSLLLNTEVFNT